MTAELVERTRRGDRKAYNRLFALAAERVHLYIRLRLGPKLRRNLDSTDVLQETYAMAHRSFDQFEFEKDGDFARWLCALSENRIRDLAEHYGAQKRRPPRGGVRVSRILDLAKASGVGPATAAGRSESRLKLEAAMMRLEEDQRRGLLYRYFENKTIEQIAQQMGRSPTAARRLLGRAVIELTRELSKSQPLPGHG